MISAILFYFDCYFRHKILYTPSFILIIPSEMSDATHGNVEYGTMGIRGGGESRRSPTPLIFSKSFHYYTISVYAIIWGGPFWSAFLLRFLHMGGIFLYGGGGGLLGLPSHLSYVLQTPM